MQSQHIVFLFALIHQLIQVNPANISPSCIKKCLEGATLPTTTLLPTTRMPSIKYTDEIGYRFEVCVKNCTETVIMKTTTSTTTTTKTTGYSTEDYVYEDDEKIEMTESILSTPTTKTENYSLGEDDDNGEDDKAGTKDNNISAFSVEDNKNNATKEKTNSDNGKFKLSPILMYGIKLIKDLNRTSSTTTPATIPSSKSNEDPHTHPSLLESPISNFTKNIDEKDKTDVKAALHNNSGKISISFTLLIICSILNIILICLIVYYSYKIYRISHKTELRIEEYREVSENSVWL